MRLGIDRLLEDEALQRRLHGRRLALLGHAASLTSAGVHSLEALASTSGLEVAAAFGPQHGMRADKQDNMIETADACHPRLGIPVFSLYGQERRPTAAMLDTFDVLLVDLQDVGTRIYTYLTTTAYMLEACSARGLEVWVLDRPNPIGRPVEGSLLQDGMESFVGVGPLPMRHGMTLGELARWYADLRGLDLALDVVAMEGWEPQRAPGFGWPLHHLPWVNPSPNASSLNMARCYPGTVLIEATNLSEGRGTSTPLELLGAPRFDAEALVAAAAAAAPAWLRGCRLRPCFFEPTFQKHAGAACNGIQLHTDFGGYEHDRFRPYRLVALLLQLWHRQHPDEPLWRDFVYEYESDRPAVDLIAGGPGLRAWIEDPAATPADLDAALRPDEETWSESRREWLLY